MTKPNRVGLVIAALIGGWHLVWVILVATGWAQPLINFIFWAHMIRPVYLVAPFDPVAAGTLLMITFFSGYVFGYVGGSLWNRVHR
jgi:hypothetical protein